MGEELQNELQFILQELIDGREVFPQDAELLEGGRVDTFSQQGLMTSNPGLVITLRDGSEFQLQIVRSR
jgi:hypothetical protein